MERKVTSHLTKGLIIGLVISVISIIAGFAGFAYETWFRWIPTILLFLAFVFVCIQYAKEMDSNVTFGQVFGHGFKTSLVVACVLVVYTIISIYVLFPEQKETIRQLQLEELDKQPEVTDSQKDQYLTMFDKMYLPIAFLSAILGPILVGLVGSLIGAAFAKKNPRPPFEQTSTL